MGCTLDATFTDSPVLTMTQSIDNVSKQARQGSVAAIIQILNERLANDGIRTRAVLAEGVLQLLCEAKTPGQLEQSSLVNQIRAILEDIGPRGISRVNINSRIVREQQLLWLEEVNRDPENQLLWSELITLKKVNSFKRFLEDAATPRQTRNPLPESSPRKSLKQRYFWRGLIGGTSLCVLIGLVGWGAWRWISPSLVAPPDAPDASQSPIETSPPAQDNPAAAPNEPEPNSAGEPTSPETPDPFVQAVRIAELAATDGRDATTAADWLDLATRWQRASDLMAQIPESDARYPTAQDRVEAYRLNSEAALAEAAKRQ